MSGRSSRESRRRALEEARRSQARRKRRLRLAGFGGGAVAVAAVATGISLAVAGPGTPAITAGMYKAGPSGTAAPAASYAPLSTLGALRPAPAPGALGPENVPVPNAVPLAGLAGKATGQDIDGIGCNSMEQTVFHIHTHLTIFVNGQPRQVPAAIGIPGAVAEQTQAGPFIGSGDCFYWLHTHAANGIIHIESPVQRTYTLGEFFDEWGQPLGPGQVGPTKGKVTVIVNGKVFTGNPRDTPLGSHENLQLEVGTPLVAPETIDWAVSGL